ncbi:MAG: 50S ribosomal protein L21 [Flavobacteriales bacterium]|nr:50S ribosomal protein L21 [Flavobacteriales bacterium]
MYAIVEIAGQQFKVQKDQRVFVNRLQNTEGSKVAFDNVLLIEDGGKITVGAPAIEGAQVTARIEKHLKGDKVIVFKKKRRKGYQKKNGFRAYLTELTIEGIAASGAKKGAAPAKVSAPAPDPAKAAAKGEDLTMIEGIGPKIAELLISKGIASYADLASAEVDALRAILDEAGGVIKSKNPGTWPAQAKLASEGKFDELRKWQEELKDSK